MSKNNTQAPSQISNDFKSSSPRSVKPPSPALPPAQPNQSPIANKSSISPISSSSNSPSSVKINQNYDPNKLDISLRKSNPINRDYVNENNCIVDESRKTLTELDNSEDTDSKPLLAHSHGPSINKCANAKYGIDDLSSDDLGCHESETLINNNSSNV